MVAEGNIIKTALRFIHEQGIFDILTVADKETVTGIACVIKEVSTWAIIVWAKIAFNRKPFEKTGKPLPLQKEGDEKKSGKVAEDELNKLKDSAFYDFINTLDLDDLGKRKSWKPADSEITTTITLH